MPHPPLSEVLHLVLLLALQCFTITNNWSSWPDVLLDGYSSYIALKSTAQFKFDTCVQHTHMLSIDFRVFLASCLHVVLHEIIITCQWTRILWLNLVNVSLITNVNKSLKTLLDTSTKSLVQHKRVSINKLDDNSMDWRPFIYTSCI